MMLYELVEYATVCIETTKKNKQVGWCCWCVCVNMSVFVCDIVLCVFIVND